MEARYCPSVGFTLLLWVAGRTDVRPVHRVSESRSVAAEAVCLKHARKMLDKLSMRPQTSGRPSPWEAQGGSKKEGKILETLDKIGTGRSDCDDSGVEAILDEVIDLEEYARLGKQPPLAKGYRFRVNADPFVVHDPTPTGLEVLTLAGLLPAKEYTLRVKFAGERPRKVGLDDKIDLRRPGVEKFKALPRDQTEG